MNKTIDSGTAEAWSDTLRTTISFLSENEQYGDDWSEEIATLTEILEFLSGK